MRNNSSFRWCFGLSDRAEGSVFRSQLADLFQRDTGFGQCDSPSRFITFVLRWMIFGNPGVDINLFWRDSQVGANCSESALSLDKPQFNPTSNWHV